MARILIIDGAGARSSDLTTARAAFDDENRKAFGSDLDVHAHTPQNQIAGINALVAAEMGEEFVRAALYGSSISYAPGVFLDALGSLLDIRRGLASKSRVVATLTGVVGTSIPAGRLAKNANGDLFASEAPVVIEEGGTKVGFIAEEVGPLDVKAGSLSEIVSVISGWDTITNETDGIEGRLQESDASYRANLRAITAHSSIGPLAALQSALVSAGATRIKILENSEASPASKGGVTLPAHSILVIADGGEDDDIARAVENHRGMGVNTYTAFEGSDFNLADAQKINNGRMRFNGQTISGFNLTGKTSLQMVDTLNAVTSLAEFGESGGRILTLHSWDADSQSYEDIGGNITESEPMFQRMVPTSAKAVGDIVHMAFPLPVITTGTFTLKYTNAGSETTATISNTHSSDIFVSLDLSASIPSTATDLKVSVTGMASPHSTGLSFTDLPVEHATDFGSTDEPDSPIVYGLPRNTGVRISAVATGTVTTWQYRRWQAGSYIDNDWVNLAGDAVGGIRVLDEETITGYTNGSAARIDVRAVNGAHGSTAARSVVFEPSNDQPTITDAHIDGDLITLTYDADLTQGTTTSSLSSRWTIAPSGGGASPASVTKQRILGRKVLLTLNNNISEGLDWTIAGDHQSVTGTNGTNPTALTARLMTNDTLGGIPSAPIGAIARRTATGWRVDWEVNHDGGLAIDRSEVSTLPVNSNVWGPWLDTTGTSYSFVTDTIPARVRVRASNPNARSATLLGLLGGVGTLPFARSIPQPLEVEVSIYRDSDITTDDFAAIKSSLIELVNSYDIGARIYQADLQARVEGIKSIRLAAALSVTSNGVNVDGVTQHAYNRFTLSSTDIAVTFVD